MFLLVQMADREFPFSEITFFVVININYILKKDIYLWQNPQIKEKFFVVNIFTLMPIFYNMISVYNQLIDIPF